MKKQKSTWTATHTTAEDEDMAGKNLGPDIKTSGSVTVVLTRREARVVAATMACSAQSYLVGGSGKGMDSFLTLNLHIASQYNSIASRIMTAAGPWSDED